MMIKLDGTTIGRGEQPYVIAEVGINARSDLEMAKQFIETAAACGADAVKFQTHLADSEMVESAMRDIEAGDVYDTVASCEWSFEEHKKLKCFAENCNVTFLSTPFSTEGVDRLLDVGVSGFKIGSGELQKFDMLERICDTGKPVLVSTGMHTPEEVSETITFLNKRTDNYALFYCVSEYPTTPSAFDFKTIDRLRSIADVPVGFSDHSNGVEAAKAAIGYGADIIEKHFTLDRRLPGPDQIVSIEPEELESLCDFADLFHETGTERSQLTEEEREIKTWARHSLVTAAPVDKGSTFDRENLTTKRPGTGIPAKKYHDVLGSTASRSLPANVILSENDIDQPD